MIASATSARTYGVSFDIDGTAQVKTWAPLATSVSLQLVHNNLEVGLNRDAAGYWYLSTEAVKPGDLYYLVIDGDKIPDPSSLFQPEGIYGPSKAVVTNSFAWTDHGWRNPLLNQYIIYELHTGTFTGEGTFSAIIERLPHLVELGITTIELMPVAQFPGERNWGYDGVFPFAVQNSYGGPEGLQKLVNACHERGLAVILDVVMNHIGPEGNILERTAPFFTDKYKTPWGRAINFDDEWCDGIREYFIENLVMWFRDFHVDAVRLDAVHAIKDFGPNHILAQARQATDQLSTETGRAYYLIAECDLNDTKYIRPVREHGYGMDAQWIDEFHHALRVAVGQSRDGYYEDFDGVSHLAKSMRDAYVYTGEYSAHRRRKFGTLTDHMDPSKFVVFSQNHDQVGNRMLGERSSVLYPYEIQKLMAATVLTSPYLPLLFMGEEYGETNPFMYFISHYDTNLVEAVRRGRREEFRSFFHDGDVPDPQDDAVFQRCKLDWSKLTSAWHATMYSYYRELIRLRKALPPLAEPDRSLMEVLCYEPKQTILVTRYSKQHHVLYILNFSGQQQTVRRPDDREWQPIFYSAHSKWHGDQQQLPAIVDEIRIAPYSFLLCQATYG